MRVIIVAVLVSSVWVKTSVAETESQQVQACKSAVEHMIRVAEESLLSKKSRPQRIEKRRKLVEEWTSRVRRNEDPCQIYEDIFKASATF